MKTRPFGALMTPVPVIGQGTWYLERVPERQAVNALVAGLDAGMTHIDTAELYGSGRVERIVGKALRGRRERVFLVSKVLPSNATYAGTIAACERSLANLATDHLDVYLLHWMGSFPLDETFRAFGDLLTSGKIRAFGVSNFDVDDLERALAIAGPDAIACNQVLYHVLERSIEHRLIPWCRRHGVTVVGYSPFGSGQFPVPASDGGRVLARIAAGHAATVHQVALAFLVRAGSVFAIPKAASVEHVLENAAAAELALTDAELAELDAAFPVRQRRGLAMI